MAGFLYFVEGFKNVPTALELAGLGLGHLGPTVSGVSCASGPCGASGITLAVPKLRMGPEGKEPKVGYYKDRQIWRRWGEYWIGFENDNPPGPGDLVRRELPGEGRGWGVKMGDGQKYIVPSVTFLPDKLSIQPDGTLKRQIKSQFKELADLTDRYRAEYLEQVATLTKESGVDEELGEEARRDASGTGQSRSESESESESESGSGSGSAPLSELEQLELCGGFLAIYYRIGAAEAEMLDLWDDDSMREALRAILDIPAYLAMGREADKKKQNGADTGSDGR